MTRHPGCRSNSAQNDSYQVPGCALECMFHFAVAGTLGDFPTTRRFPAGSASIPISSGTTESQERTGDWRDALPVIAAHPYGADWLKQCSGRDGEP